MILRLLALGLLLLSPGCQTSSGEDPRTPAAASSGITIAFATFERGERRNGMRIAAGIAAAESTPKASIRNVPATTSDLASLTSDQRVLGAVTLGGAGVIAVAREVLEEASFPVVELIDDLYDTSGLGRISFQASTPHSWQSFRLSRYFGPDDRGYRSIGLVRDGSVAGVAAAAALKEQLALRGLRIVEASGEPVAAVQQIEAARPEAVVIEGEPAFVKTALDQFAGARAYSGRSAIHAGGEWRPQLAGFETLISLAEVPPGTVAAGDYARPAQTREPIPSVQRFRELFRETAGRMPADEESRAYDSVRVILEAAGRSERSGREELMSTLERTSRKRFGKLPVSLGPDDHVFPERDVLGLWSRERSGSWERLMRTFTSDLERTNFLEEDWAVFFPGSQPGGEAPFFHAANSGVTAPKSDDFR